VSSVVCGCTREGRVVVLFILHRLVRLVSSLYADIYDGVQLLHPHRNVCTRNSTVLFRLNERGAHFFARVLHLYATIHFNFLHAFHEINEIQTFQLHLQPSSTCSTI